MEKEALPILDIVTALRMGKIIGISLSHPREVDLLQTAAIPQIGPLHVSIDLEHEMYVLRRDIREDYKKHPGKFG